MSASAILKPQASGFTTEQVTALADLIDTQAATKADVQAVEHRLDLKITEFRAFAKADLADAKADILKGMFGAMGLQTLVIIGALITILRIVKS